MKKKASIKGSNKQLFTKASRIATDFCKKYCNDPSVVGILWYGALARGYFDSFADVDIGIFVKKDSTIKCHKKSIWVDGVEIDYAIISYENSLNDEWDQNGRFAHSEAIIYSDPKGLIKKLLKKKVTLTKKERDWLLMKGTVQSEWRCLDLSKSWTQRGDLLSAHAMFLKGLDHFLDALYVYNHELIPDPKWKVYFSYQLKWLPKNYKKLFTECLLMKSLTLKDLERRRNAFMKLWNPLAKRAEKELGMTTTEMDVIV